MTKYAMALVAVLVLSFGGIWDSASAGVNLFEALSLPCSQVGTYRVCATPDSQVLPLTELDQMVTEILGPEAKITIVFWPEADDGDLLLGQAFNFFNVVVIYNTEKTLYKGRDGLFYTFKDILPTVIAHELWHLRVFGGHCNQLEDPEFLPYMNHLFTERYPAARPWQEDHNKYTRKACAKEKAGSRGD